MILPNVVTNRQTFLDAIADVRAEHERTPGPRDYRFSTVDLSRARDAREVRIAVWDVGTNPALFERQLFVNAAEQPNGQDDDGNGQTDDISGLTADANAPNTALLYDPGAEVLERYKPFLRGIMDLRAGMASTDAAERVLELMRSATDVAAVETLEKNLDAVGEWAHGTHVAGIMVAGNPHARLAVFRSAWAGEARVYHHRGPTDDELARERANVEAIAEFVNRHQIRVVNASLGFSRDYVEDQLRYEQNLYTTAEQVEARAEQIQAHRAASFRLVFERCPNTLFVVAAGNSNRDVVEYGDVPAALELPNVLVVGAVDRFGGWSTFTNSNPERVRIFDHGVEVDSLIPSGETVPLSGTSMASPNVANLAGKILAVAPSLTPAEVMDVMIETGDPIAAPFNGRIANEQRAITRARIVGRRAR
jgi:subtilisin family serine protease